MVPWCDGKWRREVASIFGPTVKKRKYSPHPGQDLSRVQARCKDEDVATGRRKQVWERTDGS